MSSINLYKFTGDRKQLNKDTNHGSTLIETVSGTWRKDIDLLNPVIEIEPTQTSTIAKITKQCNYAYVSDFGRYYYITGMTCKAGNIIELSLAIDVRFSWASEILLLDEGIVERNAEASNSNLYLDDQEIHVYNDPHIQTYEFEVANGSLAFGNQSFIMAVAGS